MSSSLVSAPASAALHESADAEHVAMPAIARPAAAPSSFAQERLWLVHRLEGGSEAYHIFRAFTLRGPLDVAALTHALGETVRRHQALRTVFREVNGRAAQVVAPFAAFPLPVEDLSGLHADARQAEVRRRAATEAARPFDLEAGPLVRAQLLRVDGDEHVLFLALHHIAADGWSMGILYRELAALYAARVNGTDAELPELPVQYADYARWSRKRLQGQVLDRERAYWRERLAGAPPLLELPTDRPRPAVQTQRGGVAAAELSTELVDRLQALARAEGASLYMVLLGAFQLLLARYAGVDDVVVGTASAGRTRRETEGLIGFFVNTLALRMELGGDPTFREVLARVLGVTLDAYDHQELPFEKVVEQLHPERSLSHSPLVQVSFALDAAGPAELALQGVDAAPLEVTHRFARYDLELLVSRSMGGWTMRAHYRADLWERGTVERMLAHLRAVLQQAAARPGARISRMDLLDDAERSALLAGWSREDAPADVVECVHERFQAWAARSADAPAVLDAAHLLTYGELNARANRLAHHLRRLGVGPEARVGVMLERGPELAVAVLAVLKAGGAYVPLDPSYPAERIAFLLDDSAVAVLVAQEATAAALPPHGGRVLRVDADADAIAREPADDLAASVHPQSAAYVIYTSGSTGRPKGVVVSHAAASIHLAASSAAYGLAPGDRLLAFAAISFDPSVEQVLAPLVSGAAVAFRGAEVWGPAEFADAVERLGVNVVYPPTAYWHALAADDAALDRVRRAVRLVLTGGEALRPSSVAAWHRAPDAPALVNVYGPAETVITSTLHRTVAGDGGAARVPVGTELAGRVPRVLDAGMRPVPASLPGELFLGGAVMARGYHGRPALTAERFVPDPYSPVSGARMYRSGDRARVLPGGALDVLGRTDEQVKIRGHRIEPGEIESALRRLSGLAGCLVLAREDATGDRRLVAYLAGRGDADALRAALRAEMPEYMVPSAFVFLDALPLSPNGKLDRRALPAPDAPAADADGAAPRTPTEEVLAGIWAELLRRDRVGIHDSFFDLGGHSLLATRAVSRIREVLGVELPLRALFEAPSVMELAGRVDDLRRAGAPVLPPVVPVERGGPLPLSFAQERLWFLDRLEGAGADYAVPATLRLGGALDAAALERALGEIVRRHEVLRTVFAETDGTPVQVIAPNRDVPLLLDDLSPLDAAEREAEMRRRAGEEAARPFDLAAGPLFRAALLRLAADDHVLLLCMHHIVSDGWSMGVLFRELSALYEAFSAGREPELAPPPVQYADYAVWQRAQLAGEALERLASYWRNQLSGAPALLELPADRPRPAVQSHRGARVSFQLSAALLDRLRALGRAEGTTLYMTLLSAWQVLLGRYAGSDDVVVGSPIAGRTRRETEELIGCFVNSLVLRTDLSGDPAFRQVLRRVRAVTLGAYEHQELPFEKLVAEVQPERSLSHAPLFQVLFLLQDGSDAPPALAGLQARAVEDRRESTKFDLSLSLSPHSGGLHGELAYSTDLFDRTTIHRIAEHLERVLEQVAADADVRLSALRLLGDDERAQVVDGWNQTAAEFPADVCIHEMFEAQATRTPDAVALLHDADALTYAELNARANRLAHHLVSLGVGPEVRVGIGLRRGPELLVALLATLKAGGAYVPLDVAYPAERIAFTLADADVAVLVTQESLRASLPIPAGLRVVSIDGESAAEIAAAGDENPLDRSNPRSLAYLIYTSGSTGVPKGVAIAHESAVALLAWAAGEFDADELSGMLACTSVCFDLSVFELFLPLSGGGRVILVENALALPASPNAGEVRLVNTVPSAAAALLKNGGIPATVTTVSLAGEPLRAELVDALYAAGIHRVYDLYGPSEDTTYSTWTLRRAGGPETIGRPIANTRAYVLGSGMQPVPASIPGELLLGGRGLARGYLGRPALTAERFIPDPFSSEPGGRLYRTGDRVRWNSDGTLRYLGRQDAQVKVRGYRIELGEIETVIRRHPAVRECVVIVREDAPGDRRLAAYAAGDVDADELRAHLRHSLPEHMVPGAILLLDALPLNPNGKLDRKALPAPEHGPAADAFVAPSTPVEKALAGIWAEVLRVERVGVRDNFFDLGGHSLLATRVVSRIREALDGDVGVASLFENPTISGLAALCYERRAPAPLRSAGGLHGLLASIDDLSDEELDRLLGGNPEIQTFP